jgi:hypothetical protein
MVPPYSDRISRVPPYLLSALVPHVSFHVRGYHPLWPAFPDRSIMNRAITDWLFRFRSPLLSESRLISVPPGTEMFQFSGFASPGLCIQPRMTFTAGFPHSEICGSKLVCQLPAAYRKLLRPSSHVIAKASTICTYSLDPITLNPCSRVRLGKKHGAYKEVMPGYRDVRVCAKPLALTCARSLVDTITTHVAFTQTNHETSP